MKLTLTISDAVAAAIQQWSASGYTAPLTIQKNADGFVIATSLKTRYTAGEFAEFLGMSRGTWCKRVKAYFGLTPASDGRYDVETIEWARRNLRLEESRKTPHELRRARNEKGAQ